ncbi:MAG: 3-dehydroquinate synthase [Bacteroidales bacterium]|nr:3-dehydroquinate synthase [Bacteroidales bacterium]
MKSHNILYSKGNLPALKSLNRHLKSKQYLGSRFFILGDSNTIDHCLPLLVSEVGALQESEFFEVESGEECKDLAVAENLWLGLLESGADRNAVIINLGGGTVCDLGGFVAAAYKRGVRYINVPTTLLAMVDAAIGGKTAINVGGIKNQAGFFHKPQCVCIEPEFLQTLPQRELLSGTFEMAKTFAVADKERYSQFCRLWQNDFSIGEEMIYACANIKDQITKHDFKDTGERKILNFGHTFGHAIEGAMLKYGKDALSHGEAVGLGMVCAMYLSTKKTGLPEKVYGDFAQKVRSLLGKQHFSKKITDTIIYNMCADKKNASGEIRCVLLKGIGEAVYDIPVSEDEIRDALGVV